MRKTKLSLVGLAVVFAAGMPLWAQSSQTQKMPIAEKERVTRIHKALERLPYYGVFDFLAFAVDRGTVTLEGYAYRPSLKDDAQRALRNVSGVDEIANKIEVLPVSQLDDEIRWGVFYRIYTDDFLSRYAPGGPFSVRYDLLNMRRYPGMQPFGTYPIHIIVKNRQVTLLGVVDNEGDKTMAAFRAREVPSSAGVENELMVGK